MLKTKKGRTVIRKVKEFMYTGEPMDYIRHNNPVKVKPTKVITMSQDDAMKAFAIRVQSEEIQGSRFPNRR